MHNWSTDEEQFKKMYPQEYRLWRLVQLVNYGLDGEKLDTREIVTAWPQIKERLDPDKRSYLEYLLWPPHSRK